MESNPHKVQSPDYLLIDGIYMCCVHARDICAQMCAQLMPNGEEHCSSKIECTGYNEGSINITSPGLQMGCQGQYIFAGPPPNMEILD